MKEVKSKIQKNTMKGRKEVQRGIDRRHEGEKFGGGNYLRERRMHRKKKRKIRR